MVLDRIMATAKQRGLRQLSLETGRGIAIEPAAPRYRQAGFQEGSAFGERRSKAFSRFFHLSLQADSKILKSDILSGLSFDSPTGRHQVKKSFFVSFFTKKEMLTFPSLRPQPQ
ncbi:hypothetical protein [Acidiphilium sp.]|uniref:hypothetical protein n=1 Tax=Acidiphilium sp. TaxID=527 RepID=UPI003D06A165